ncbi:MAG: four helix bundle protein [Patescibacteria group bacterium]
MVQQYHDKLKLKMDDYVHGVYKISKVFPKEELYGVTSQLRRAALSVILNYIEGFARRRGNECKVYKNFLEISYGSLKESKYLLYFAFTENYMQEKDYRYLISLADEIGAMLFGVMQ